MTGFEKALTPHPEKPGVSGDAVGETTLKPGNGLVKDGGACRTTIYVQFSDCGQHIRKWSPDPFDGGQEYGMVTRNWACVVDGEWDTDPTCVIDDHRYEDCLHAKPGMCREDCKYWQNIKAKGAS